MAFPTKFKPETILKNAKARLDQKKNNVYRSWIHWHLDHLDSIDFAENFPEQDAELNKKYPPDIVRAEKVERRSALLRESVEIGVKLPDLEKMNKTQLKKLL